MHEATQPSFLLEKFDALRQEFEIAQKELKLAKQANKQHNLDALFSQILTLK